MPLLAFAALAVVFTSGCTSPNPEDKLGRGVSNTLEVARMGEMRRCVEQTVIFGSPGQGYATGVIRGFDHTVAREAMGIYEIVTFPLPPYGPLGTNYVTPGAVYPASYRPKRLSDSLFDTDTYMGYGSGDVAPYIIGSRFSVFNN